MRLTFFLKRFSWRQKILLKTIIFYKWKALKILKTTDTLEIENLKSYFKRTWTINFVQSMINEISFTKEEEILLRKKGE